MRSLAYALVLMASTSQVGVGMARCCYGNLIVILTNSTGETTYPKTENAEITEPPQLPVDINDDGVVNIVDLTLVASNFVREEKMLLILMEMVL